MRTLGPDSATLSIRTARLGAASKAGHDLLIKVGSWEGTLDTDAPSVWLKVDSTSLRVHKGTGGMQALDDDDKANIEQTIDDEVLKKTGIEFRSTAIDIADDGSRLSVRGDLTLVGTTHPLAFDVAVGADGLLVEVHHQPEKALSDGIQSIIPSEYAELMSEVRAIASVLHRSLN